jgi:hypothetical protein
MYLGIDFLITPESRLYLIEVNVGLPGGAHEYHLAHIIHTGSPPGIFRKIEEISKKVYGKTFKNYLNSIPFIESLKSFKIWMDGMGPFPENFHPGLRLEDKWNQYQLVRSIAPMPDTIEIDPSNLKEAEAFIEKRGKAALKRRVGRGGRGFRMIHEPSEMTKLDLASYPFLLQEYVDSKTSGYSLSIRSVSFGGEFLCMYANLSSAQVSNHGILTFVVPGDRFGLRETEFETESFDQRSWEAEVWFGQKEPEYLRHNLYEEKVAKTSLILPEKLYHRIEELSVKVERLYEGLALADLPKACFEK